MPTDIIMPALELAQETGKVVHWLKRAGDTVRKGEPIVEIETDKVTVEIEAPASGVLRDVTAQEGDVVPVGRTIAIVVGTDEAGAAAAAATVMPPASAAATGAIPIPPTAVSAAGGAVKASPLARRIAEQHGVDIARVRTPSGRVEKADVLAYVESQKAAGNGREGRLVAAALSRHPRVNASWRDDAIAQHTDINIGLAVAIDDGLVVPVIHRADTLGLAEIAARREDAVSRAQAGKLRPGDIQGGGFTISNLGMYGVDAFSAIVNPPQAAILAVGRIADRVVARNGQPAVLPTMMLTLSCDHRALDGARGAQFLGALADLVEEPLALLV